MAEPFRRPGFPEQPPSPFCVMTRLSIGWGFRLVFSFRCSRPFRVLGPPCSMLLVVSGSLWFSVVWG